MHFTSGIAGPNVREIRFGRIFSGCESIVTLIRPLAFLHVASTNCLIETDASSLSSAPQRVSLLTRIVDYSSTINLQFEPRWHESNSGHNEENLQCEQKEVFMIALSLFAVMKATKGLGWLLHNPNANALSDHAQS
jgi:hypothetical protein